MSYTIHINESQRALLALLCRLFFTTHPSSRFAADALELADMLHINAIEPAPTINDFTA